MWKKETEAYWVSEASGKIPSVKHLSWLSQRIMPPALQIVLAIKRVPRPVTFIIVNVSQQAPTCTLIFHDIRDFHGLLVTLLDPPKVSTNEVNTMGVRAKPTPQTHFFSLILLRHILFLGLPFHWKVLGNCSPAMKLKDTCSLEGTLWQTQTAY